jgi:hypothetical protein
MDLICALRDAGVPMTGGFHSPMEKECLTLLLRGTQPVIVCPARGIHGMRLPVVWQQPLTEKRLLLLSPFDKKHRRITAAASDQRNAFVAALADQVLIAHAAAGSKTEAFARQLLASGKAVWTVASKQNEDLVGQGATVVDTATVESRRLFSTNAGT